MRRRWALAAAAVICGLGITCGVLSIQNSYLQTSLSAANIALQARTVPDPEALKIVPLEPMSLSQRASAPQSSASIRISGKESTIVVLLQVDGVSYSNYDLDIENSDLQPIGRQYTVKGIKGMSIDQNRAVVPVALSREIFRSAGNYSLVLRGHADGGRDEVVGSYPLQVDFERSSIGGDKN